MAMTRKTKVKCDVDSCKENAEIGIYNKKTKNIIMKYCNKHFKRLEKSVFNKERHIARTRQFGRKGINWRIIKSN